MASKRKKKRKASESMERFKPPLMFVESPVQGSKHYCTPVQAARNPYMAPSFPVEDLTAKWVSPQFPQNENFPIFQEARRRQRRNMTSKDEQEKGYHQHLTKMTILPLDFENKVQSAQKESNAKAKLRCSSRLKSKKLGKQNHFLFKQGNSMTPNFRDMKVLVPETPECSLVIPAVLRKLRNECENNEKSQPQKKRIEKADCKL